MADDQTIQPADVKREHFWHVFGNLVSPLIVFVVLPALGVVGYFIFDALGFDLRGSLSAKPIEGLQVSGMLVLLIIATAACLGISGYFFIREIYRWRKLGK